MFYRCSLIVNESQVMQFKVAQLLKEPVGATRDYLIDDTICIFEESSQSRITGNIHFLRTNRGILARGYLNTVANVSCSRCLEVFNCELEYKFEEEYFPTVDMYYDLEINGHDDPESFTIDEDQVLDITEAARQYAILSIPMKPLCRPGCPGLI